MKQRILFLMVIFVIIFGFVFFQSNKTKVAIAACDEIEQVDSKLNCWYEILRQEVRSGGAQKAFSLFPLMYEYDDFVRMSCHEHAHIIGDTVYYEDYLLHENLEKIDFPPESAYCGYGFYHGFVEHMVQDKPVPNFVDETCEYMQSRLGATMNAIEYTCYHGAGHGFMLAPVERSLWGNFVALVKKPLQNCEALNTTSHNVEECKVGVFNVIGRWMIDEEYGLAYDFEDPFVFCRKLEKENREPCYNEIAQKLDSLSGWDPVRAAEFLEHIEDDHLAARVMGVATAGMVLRDLVTGEYYRYIDSCRNVPERLKSECLEGIVAGIFEYGDPGSEYEKAYEFCEFEDLRNKERSLCYGVVLEKFDRFYTTKQQEELCRVGSLGFQEACREVGIDI